MYHYTPVPQRGNMYGDIDGQITFPSTPAEWATKEWMDFTLRIDTQAPWLKRRTKELIDNFEIVVGSRWPTVQDILAPRWSRMLAQDSQLLALCSSPLPLSSRTPLGESLDRSAQAQAGESVTTMMATPSDVFDTWAQVYDEQPNPLLALEQRFLTRMLPDVAGLDVLDAGCGTGRWLQLLAPQRPASLLGVDISPQMLERASTSSEPHPRCDLVAVSHCPFKTPLQTLSLPLSFLAISKTSNPLLASYIALPGPVQPSS